MAVEEPQQVAVAARRRLGLPPPAPARPPLVSIVVVSHEGLDHLRVLLGGLIERTDYPRLELIVVDNGSGDGSVAFLRSARAPFPIPVVANQRNESFSVACNQGAELAGGELLLFLNNDVEPFEDGWLRELVACLEAGGRAAVGATLLFPNDDRDRFPHGFAVQHRGLRFRDENGTIAPALHGWGAEPLDERLGEDVESAAVVAACLLVEATAFELVGGFTRGYLYGAEDIDLCLKLRDAGMRVICSGRSLLIHRPGSTRRAIAFEQARERKLRNHRLLLEHWGPRLRREHDLCTLAGGGIWAEEGCRPVAVAATPDEAGALGVCVRAGGPDSRGAGADPVEELRASAIAAGRRCLVLRGDEVDDLRGLEQDVAIDLRGLERRRPAPGQFNVLWAPAGDPDLSEGEREPYDLTLSGDAGAVLGSALAAAPRRRLACAS